MGMALKKLSDEDPTFKISSNTETGETIISGMGELHLEIMIDRMKREFSVDANVGKPQVAYRETITGTAEAEHKYIKQSGGKGQYGHVKITLKPMEKLEEGAKFQRTLNDMMILNSSIQSKEASFLRNSFQQLKKAFKEAMERGIVAGFRMVNISANSPSVHITMSTLPKSPIRLLPHKHFKMAPSGPDQLFSNQ
jgi:elongation factor G